MKEKNELKAENISNGRDTQKAEKQENGISRLGQKLEGEINAIEEDNPQKERIKEEIAKEEVKKEKHRTESGELREIKDENSSDHRLNENRIVSEKDEEQEIQKEQQDAIEKIVEESAVKELKDEDSSKSKEVETAENKEKSDEHSNNDKRSEDIEIEEGEMPCEQKIESKPSKPRRAEEVILLLLSK